MASYSSLSSPICSWLYASSESSAANVKHRTSKFCAFQSPKRHKMLLSRSRCSINGFSGKTVAVSLQHKDERKTEKLQRKVTVTGMGVVTPVGHDPDEFYSNLLEGVSGISEIEGFDCSKFPTRIAGEIKSLSTDGLVSPKHAKRADKFMLYILTAGKKALADGGVTEQVNREFDKIKCGVLIGSALGGMKTYHEAIEAGKISLKKVSPFTLPYSTTNIGSAVLAMDLGWMGPNYSISSACATGNSCILNAAHHIIKGDADIMLCGGSDAAIIPAVMYIIMLSNGAPVSILQIFLLVHELTMFSFLIIGAAGLAGFVASRSLSERNNDPTKASRPWDSDRDGLVVGEGAGVLLLEEMEHAKRRGAKIYAEFVGGSFSSDAYNIAEPHPDGMGIVSCIEKALAQYGVAREDVNYINAHASSTPVGDLIEYQALMQCFGQNPELKVNSTKSMIGHLMGASGAVEAVATVMAIKTGWLHPNLNLENPDKFVDRKVLVGSKKECLDIKVALSNSFGLGGHNSSILFAPYKQD